MIHSSNLRWGLLSKYRTELMGIACLWVMLHHNFFDWPPSLSVLHDFAVYGSLAVDIFLLLTAPYWLWLDVCVGSGSFWQDLFQVSFPLRREITTWYVPTITAFYLVYPFVEQYLSCGCRWRRASSLCMAWVALCVAVSGTAVYDNCEIGLTRFVIFVVGCALGKAVREDRCLLRLTLPMSIGWLFVNWLLRRIFSLPLLGIRLSYVPLALAVTLLLVWMLEKLQQYKGLRRLLQFFGQHSLELYLSHILVRNVWVHYWGNRLVDPWGIVPYCLILLISVVISRITHPFAVRLIGYLTSAAGKEA